MFNVLQCPSCHRPVAVPPDVELESSVRCPLCESEYTIADAMPPQLIPLGPTPAASPEEAIGPAAAFAAGAAAAPVGPDLPPSIEPVPADASDQPAAEVETAAKDDLTAVDEGESPADQTGEEKPEDGEGDIFGFLQEQGETATTEAEEGEEAKPGAAGLDLGSLAESGAAVGAGTTAGAAMFPAGEAPAGRPEAATAPARGAAPRRRRKPKSAAKEVVGALIGAVVGLSLGYWGLNFFMGEQMDFLKVYLPGVAHTQNNWPFGGGDAETSSADPSEQAEPEDQGLGFPPDPRPEGAIGRPFSRYLDMNYRQLILSGKLQTEEHTATVPIEIGEEIYPTAPDGKVVTVTAPIHVGGVTFSEGMRLKKEDLWWVDLSKVAQAEPQPEQPATDQLAQSEPGADPFAEPAEPEDDPFAQPAEPFEPPADPLAEQPGLQPEPAEPQPEPTEPREPAANDVELAGADEAVEDPAVDVDAVPEQPATEQAAEPVTESEPLPADYIGPKDPPRFSMAELDEAIAAAEATIGKLQPGEQLTADHYRALRRLAHRLTFVAAKPLDLARIEREDTVARLLQRLVAQPGRFAELGQWAAGALDTPAAQGGGVVMTGVVGRMASKGNLHGSSVALPDGQAVLSVMSDHPLTIDEADPVVVVGTLVTKPRENMIGYPGTKPIIVWAAQGIPVPGVDLSGG